MATNFIVNLADLTHILKQIILAENTSIGYTPAVAPVSITQAIMDAYGVSAVNATQLPFGLRTVDGTYNNLMSDATSEFGAADTFFPRLTDPVFQNVDGPGIDFNGDGLIDVINHNYGDASAAAGYQIRSVADSDPRTITNLIVDMSVNNPAAISTFLNNPLSVEAFEAEMGISPTEAWFTDPANVVAGNVWLQVIPNQSPDIGLSPGFNAWMTFFGQFFDHGLDLVTKGTNGTVYIPLAADDPLYDKGKDGIANNFVQAKDGDGNLLYYTVDPAGWPVGAPPPATSTTVTAWAAMFSDDGFGADGLVGTFDDRPNFMALSRATATIDANGIPQHENTTTAWIDQNQTYTSHSSHQVFLREYVKDAAGRAVSTGRLIDGTTASGSVNGAIGNWGEVKAQALTMLGIRLDDFDVHNVPLLLTDQYGKFIPGANGYAQLVMAPDATHASNWLKEGTAAGITTAGSIGTNHAFLNDIAHHAAPALVDLDHNPATPAVRQTADTDTLDFNGDGVIDNADLVAGLGVIRDANHDGLITIADLADVNLDGEITAADRVADDRNPLTYDDEMLNSHMITGDGRGNENIALTTVHSIFHSEHNRLVEANKATILASGDLAFINEWLLTDIASLADIDTPAEKAALIANAAAWDGERLFQAARFGTEMQYQHLVFEEFARRIQPMVDPFLFQNSPNIDPSIVAEFAHTVYRFGHSMLTGTVDRLDNNLETVDGLDQKTLLAVFLNPQAYIGSGADLEEINANIIRGLSRDVGNAMDEFIVTDVRSNLLGLPLDLGALNIARGRDTGIPSLNETRRQLYNDTGFADLKPYESWADFAANITNAASIVNFIAAYGTHTTITGATTMAGKRAAAELIVFGGTGAPADRLDFINATGAYAGGSLGGLNLIDLWIGGLAEAHPEFGGMLGTTFNYVFEAQMESLQDGDRMYYLSRTQGMNFINQLEPNTFADLVMRNTDLGDKYATHVNGFLFVTPDHILELDRMIAQENYNDASPYGDPTWGDGEPHSPFDQKVTRSYSGVTADGGHDVGANLRYIGGEHLVVGGTEGNDRIVTDRGIDTLWGDGGNDYLNAGTESDNVFGGDGDDIIEDPFGDNMLRGNAGNDVIATARGANILFGNEGSDVLMLGQDAGEVFGGTDTDFILGSSGSDGLLGNEGDDWLEGGAGLDVLSGDNSDIFFNSLIIGNDVMFGQGDETDYDAESGDDIMGSGPNIGRYEGMFGFDYTIGKNNIEAVYFDLNKQILVSDQAAVLRSRFDHVEAISGWGYDDTLLGDDRGHFLTGTVTTAATADSLFINDILTQTGINLIAGFNSWFGGARQTLFGGATPLVIGSEVATSFRDGNIILGGDGSDTLQGRGGYDLLDGDAWLNVRIGINLGGTYYSAESLNSDPTQAGAHAGFVYRMIGNNPQGDVDFSSPAFGGRSLQSLLLDRTINPAQMSIVREIKYDATNVTGAGMNIDTAQFFGSMAEYDIEGRTVDADGNQLTAASDVNGDGWISVHDRDDGVTGATVNGVTLTSRRLLIDDTDLVKNIEQLRFLNVLNPGNVQTLVLSGPTPTQRPALDLNGVVAGTGFTSSFSANGAPAAIASNATITDPDSANILGAQIRLTNAQSLDLLSIAGALPAGITSSFGPIVAGQITLLLSGTASLATYQAAIQQVRFSSDSPLPNVTPRNIEVTVRDDLGSGPVAIATVNVIAVNNAPVLDLNAAAAGTGSTSTFTEDGAAAAIGVGVAITDADNVNMTSAQIRLTNAQALDVLSIAGALPVGITSTLNTAVAGQITITLSGLASIAAYQTAIGQVRYSTTSQNPVVTPRNIEVTVNDGQANSVVAISTVNVVAVNDAPVAVNDTVITNLAAGASIVIPNSALLANDTDVDSAVLSITALSAATGVTGLSLATNPGSVTLVDDATPGGAFTYTASDGALTGNGRVTLVRQGAVQAQVADNFNGAGNVRSAANNSTGTTAWATSWTELDDGANTLQTGQIQIDGGGGNGTNQLRFVNGDGGSITRGVNLSGASSATLSFAFDKNGIDVGEFVQVQFAADGVNFVNVTGGLITNTNNTNANGNAAGTLSLQLTGALGANSAIRFLGSAISTAGEDIRIDNVAIAYSLSTTALTGTAAGEIILGNSAASVVNALGGNDRIIGGGGDDTVNAGDGDDTIIWSVGDGRDVMDGGANGVVGDRFIVNGDDSVEAYVVYARADATAAGIAVLNAATEIVVTRNGVVVAELDGIEEITINTRGGADTVTAIGNFNPTQLAFNTITVNGGPDARIDASQLTSAHHLVLNQSGSTSVGGAAPPTPSAPSAPVEAEFGGISQGMVNALARNGLADLIDSGFIGSRQHGMFAETLSMIIERGSLHNPVFDREVAMDFMPNDSGHDGKLLHQALHFDAADHLIS